MSRARFPGQAVSCSFTSSIVVASDLVCVLGRGQVLSAAGVHQKVLAQNVSITPASTLNCKPVTKRDSSEARKHTALEMSDGSTYGVGIACMAGNATSASSRVGACKSGRNCRYMGSLFSIAVLTFVGWTTL